MPITARLQNCIEKPYVIESSDSEDDGDDNDDAGNDEENNEDYDDNDGGLEAGNKEVANAKEEIDKDEEESIADMGEDFN